MQQNHSDTKERNKKIPLAKTKKEKREQTSLEKKAQFLAGEAAEFKEAAETEKVREEDSAAQQEVGELPGQLEATTAQTATQTPSPLVSQVENILEEDLEDIYFNLDEAHQKVFKEEGEKTARQITSLIEKAKATVKTILSLIKRWLLLIPGVNKFFVEQEAKIKTDKILALKTEE